MGCECSHDQKTKAYYNKKTILLEVKITFKLCLPHCDHQGVEAPKFNFLSKSNLKKYLPEWRFGAGSVVNQK